MTLLTYSRKQYLKDLPGVLWLHYHLKPREKWPLVVNGRTLVCVAGFPRSANSYSFHCLHSSLDIDPTRIAHHTHSTANVRRAVARGLPTFVLVREPRECCLSLTLFRPDVPGIADALRAYEDFHSRLMPMLERIAIVPTEIFLADPGVFLKAVARALGIAPPKWDGAQAEHVKRLMAGFNAPRVPAGMTIPHEERARAKEELWNRSQTPRVLERLERCRKLRERILATAPNVLG